MQRSTIRRVGRRLVLPLWLPLAILVATAIRFATLSPGEEASGMPNAAVMIALMVLFAWIAAIPLTLAVTYLHRRVRVVAYVCGAVLVPLTVYGAVVGGVFGPVGVVLSTRSSSRSRPGSLWASRPSFSATAPTCAWLRAPSCPSRRRVSCG